MNISPARIAAVEILVRIERERAFSSVLLPLYETNLPVKDRALCHALTLGTLRRQLYLDRLIDELTTGKKLDAVVRVILRVALFQLIDLERIPAHAAINDAVNLTKRAKKTSARGLVNAVLRNFTRREIKLNYADDIERVSIETSHPRWLIERWNREFGAAATENLARANNRTPPTTFRLTRKSNANTVEILSKLGAEISRSELIGDAFHINGATEMTRAYADEGEIYFQDEGSQLVAESINLQDGETFLDVCAAPGSKLTQAANSQFQILAVGGDSSASRMAILQANCRRQAAENVALVRYDAEENLPFADESFDVVLVDAPCSGTGTIRHNPEIRFFTEEKDFAALAEKQLRILNHASKVVKSNGRLIYATCSLENAENEAVAERFEAENKRFEKSVPKAATRFLTGAGYARTFPPTDDCDGFFIAEFVKKPLFS